MKQRSGVLFLFLGVLAAALAAILAVRIVEGYNETTPVLVAARDLAPYQTITQDDIRVQNIPTISVPADAVSSLEEVVGKYTRDAIYTGETIRRRRLADARGDRGLLAAQLTDLQAPTLRAFALPYEPGTAVGGEVKPGDRVDIVASVKIDAGSGVAVGVGKIVAANVQVLKLAGDTTGGSKGAIIVALEPDQIEDIAFALTSGQLRFALNPYTTDVTAAETGGVTGQTWLEKYGFLDEPGDSEDAQDQ